MSVASGAVAVDGRDAPGLVHRIALALVWVTVASGAIVFSEPAPVDLLMMGLVVLLPVIGLVRISPALLVYLGLWLAVVAASYVASAQAVDLSRATMHTTITLYLVLGSVVVAGFVMRNPVRHATLVLDAYLWAAFIGSVAAVVGYFGLVPGAQELFTKFGRAAGTFKDPNVFGPFLIPAAIYALHRMMTRTAGAALLSALMLAFLGFAVLLSFSRGAWGALALGVALYLALAFVTAESERQRARIVLLAALGGVTLIGVIVAALQIEEVARLFEVRASLDQSYDFGPEGRFGGQEKAKRLIVDNPLGLGALEFSSRYHSEDVHNVYLSMLLNGGWVGGLVYLALILVTLALGYRAMLRGSAIRPLLVPVLAALTAHVALGWVIDTDHWRHFFLLMGLAWGLVLAEREGRAAEVLQSVQHLRMRTARVLRRTYRPARRLVPAVQNAATVPGTATALRSAGIVVTLRPARRLAQVIIPRVDTSRRAARLLIPTEGPEAQALRRRLMSRLANDNRDILVPSLVPLAGAATANVAVARYVEIIPGAPRHISHRPARAVG